MRPNRPTLRAWIRVNLEIGALSFGSAGRALLYHEAIVDDLGWMSAEEFNEVFTIAQVLPGPNLVNLSLYLGHRLFGWPGAGSGLIALCVPGALLLVVANGLFGALLALPSVVAFVRGIALGSITMFLALIARVARGLRETDGASRRAGTTKRSLRFLLAAALGTAALASAPIGAVLVAGMIAGLLVEFGA